MALGGTIFGGLLGGFGDKPTVPPFRSIDLGTEQQNAIRQNISALPIAEDLASGVNRFNQEQLDTMLEHILPGYDQIRSRIAANIKALVSGEIPEDVSQQIQRQGAAKSLYGGYGGTGMGRNLVARDLGRTSLELTQKGLDSATRWMSAAKAPQMDVTSMFVTPMQRAAFSQQERDSEWNRNWLANQVSASPDPFMSALTQAMIYDENMLLQTGASLGGAFGKSQF